MNKIDQIKSPVVTKQQLLPFEDLTWDNFEQLCMKLAQEQSSVNNCERYGRQGSSQDGIDIFVINHNGKFDVFQCKKYKKFGVGELDSAVLSFKNGKFYSKTKTFTICTACELNSIKLQEHFNQHKIDLFNKKIDLIKWDKIQLSTILKNYPRLVFDFFNEYWLKEFIGIDKDKLFYEENKLSQFDYTTFIDKLQNNVPYYIRREVVYYNIKAKIEEKKSLLEFWKENKKVVLLASAGLGKTEELKQTAFAVAKERKGYPVFIELRNYTSEKYIEDFLPQEIDDLINNSPQVFLFFDGFDELIPEQREIFQRKLNIFAKSLPEINIVISSRTNFYDKQINPLVEFYPVELCDLTYQDIVEYTSTIHKLNGHHFINEVYNSKFEDLVYNPFYLNALIEDYKTNDFTFSNRYNLLTDYLSNRIKSDKSHFNGVIPTEKMAIVLHILQKIALAMQMLYVRKISDADILEIIKSDDFDKIKFTGIFSKSHDEDMWFFAHNNFLELLCAQAIKNFQFETIIELITFKDYNKINPNWSNVVVFLISILDKKDPMCMQLINWIIENDHEVLITAEKEKITIELRNDIFKRTFNYYKTQNIWLSSNKFQIKEFAVFGSSPESVEFILNEFFDSSNERRVRQNALMILKHFDLAKVESKQNFVTRIIDVIKNEKPDGYFIHDILYGFSKLIVGNKDYIQQIIELLGDRKSAYVRAGIYSIINKSSLVNENVYYYIEGVNILQFKRASEDEDREGTQLADEHMLLYEGIKSLNTSEAIQKFISYYINHYDSMESEYDFNHIYDQFILNCVEAYFKDNSFFENMLMFYGAHFDHWRFEKAKQTLIFFEKTNTIDKGFETAMELFIQNKSNKSDLLLCSFLTEQNIDKLLSIIVPENIYGKSLEELYVDTKIINFGMSEIFRNKSKLAGVDIVEQQTIDYDGIRRLRNQQSFDLLFNVQKLKDECIRIFEDNESVSQNYLFGFKKGKYYEIENEYYESALRILRDFCNNENKSVKKDQIIKWFGNEKSVLNYLIAQIQFYLKQDKDYKVTTSEYQNEYIKNWCDKALGFIDFKKAISSKKDGSFTINNNAMIFVFFIQKFNFEVPEHVLLDMLFFTFDENTLSFDYLINKLPKEKLDKRICQNISDNSITSEIAFLNHVKYIYQNKFEKAYNSILEIISDINQDYYNNYRIIDSYFENQINPIYIKKYFNRFIFRTQTDILSWLIKNGDTEYVNGKLISYNRDELDMEQTKVVNNLLVSCGNIKGLEYTVDWIKKSSESPFSQHATILSYFSDVKALDYMFELLDLSFNTKIKENHPIDKMWPIVVDGIQYLALSKRENFSVVIDRFKEFIELRKGKTHDIEFLNLQIHRIEEEFFKKYTPIVNMRDVKLVIKNI